MDVTALLAHVDSLYDSEESDAIKVSFMNLALEDLYPYFGPIMTDNTLVTVADQDNYALPTGIEDVSDIISLGIGNQATPSDRYDYTRYHLSKVNEDPMIWNSYYQIYDDAGDKQICLYPIPSTDDLPISIRYRARIPELSVSITTDEPAFDSKYHSMLAYYCAKMLCTIGSSPDESQANAFMAMYDEKLNELWRKAMDDEIENPANDGANHQWKSAKRHVNGF